MSVDPLGPLDEVVVIDDDLWADGPPDELFRRLRSECPVHWSKDMPMFPEEDGYWSVTTAEGVREVSLDWQTYSSERGGITRAEPTPVCRSSCPRRCSSGWTRPSTTGSRRSSSAASLRSGSPSTRSAIRAITGDVLDRLEGRETCDLVDDVAQPVVSRVIGSFMGLPPGDDVIWARLMNTIARRQRPRGQPGGHGNGDAARRAGGVRALSEADRRPAREPDRRPDQRARPRRGRRREARGARDRHGLLPADGGRQRQHQGDLLQRDAGAARGPRRRWRCCSRTRR